MPIYDGGFVERPEEEREDEASWQDGDDGDLPWAPRHVDDPEPWKEQQWGGTPEEKMYRDKLGDEGKDRSP